MIRNLQTKKLQIMKTVLSFITIAAVVTACNSNPKMGAENMNSNGTVIMLKDTSGLADFQAWKAYEADKNYSAARRSATSSAAPVRKTSSARTSNARSTVSNTKSETISTEAAYPAKAPAKKGWSKAAKGAAIGGATGAVAGAVINKKNRVIGGVVGGVLGAGAGYGIGRTMDKKDGRYLVSQ
jgi:hypothetical protein